MFNCIYIELPQFHSSYPIYLFSFAVFKNCIIPIQYRSRQSILEQSCTTKDSADEMRPFGHPSEDGPDTCWSMCSSCHVGDEC